jgi:2-amino-4-hydroxy-6-hydroxymethyldihydropteridine diphosphokinase
VSAHDAYIALGSNLSDPPQQIRAAISAIKNLPTTEWIECAPPRWYAPVGGPPYQGNFLNSAAHIRTKLTPDQLLSQLLAVETQQGRRRNGVERYGPRTIDLDLLFYENLIINTHLIRVPHPRLTVRYFVLEPLAVIAPDWMHPIAEISVAELLRRLQNGDPWIDPQEESSACKSTTT